MEIRDVTASTHEIPINLPLLDDEYSIPLVFVQIDTDDGLSGYGLTGSLWIQAVETFVNEQVSPLLEGEDPRNVEAIWDLLKKQFNLRSQTGVWSSGVSAVDIACWDLKGKAVDAPVWQLLGGARDEVPAYVTYGHPDYSESQLVEMAEELVSQGENRLKMVVGTGHRKDSGKSANIARDASRVRAVRDAVPADVELMIDANHTLSIDEAKRLGWEIEECDITWFEEPVYANDESHLTDLRRSIDIPIGAGQNEGHREKHRRLIDAGAIDVCQPNVVFCGGYTEGRKIAALAEANNLRIANGGGYPFQNLHLHAAVNNGWRVEYHYFTWKAGEQLYRDPPVIDGGSVTAPTEPGLGLDPDLEFLGRHQL